MGDQLENFIQRNREQFDDDINPESLWHRIEKDLERPPFSFAVVWKIAAVLLLISTVILGIDKLSSNTQESSFYAEFQQAESFYTTLIMEKRNEIASFEINGLTEAFLKEIDNLDEMYEELKRTFDEETSDQKLIDAMITNLQLRIQILNKQLTILEQLNNTNNEGSETLEI